jgi:Cys-tRNA(Pro) deacylase
MKDARYPVTTAIRALRAANATFEPHLYNYVERGGTRVSARELGVDEHTVIKTLVLLADGAPLIALMHGDHEVSTKSLARLMGAKTVEPCTPQHAEKLTGYQVGGTSPFGTRTRLPVFAQKSIENLDRIYINGGKRGFLVAIAPSVLDTLLTPTWAEFVA